MAKLRFRYETIDFDSEVSVHVRALHDTNQFLDEDGVAEALGISPANWSLFGVLWTSGRALATMMFERDIEGVRILEVGCGLGLASLVLNQRLADVTATDYHPEAEKFLEASVALNDAAAIPFVRTSWAEDIGGLGLFDLIIGADILYEPGLVESLAVFIDSHAAVGCEVIIIDPNRGNRARFGKKMSSLGYSERRSTSSPTRGASTDVLSFVRAQTLVVLDHPLGELGGGREALVAGRNDLLGRQDEARRSAGGAELDDE